MAHELPGIIFATGYRFWAVISDVEMAHPRHQPIEVTPPPRGLYFFKVLKYKGTQYCYTLKIGLSFVGMVMSMYTLLRNKPKPSMEDVTEYFKGNLCRCTGYRPILESMRTLCIEPVLGRKQNEGRTESWARYSGSQNGLSSGVINGFESKEDEVIHNDVPNAGSSKELVMNEANRPEVPVNGAPSSSVSNAAQVNGAPSPSISKEEINSNGFRDIMNEINQSLKEGDSPANQEDLEEVWQGKGCGGNTGCCGGSKGTCCKVVNNKSLDSDPCRPDSGQPESNDAVNPKFQPYDQTQEPIFPPNLVLNENLDSESAVFKGERVTWHRPVSLQELQTIKEKHPNAKIVVGNTEVGIETKFKNCEYPVMIHPSHVKEMNEMSCNENGVKFGAAMTLDQVEARCKEMVNQLPKYQTAVLSSIVEMLQWFAGKQIRCVASIGGNIMTGSPISDLNPIFMASQCRLEVASVSGFRTVLMDQNFYTGYRKNCLKADEVLVSITLPFTRQNEFFKAYKQARRRDDDIAIVNAAFKVLMVDSQVKDVTLCYGGLAPTTKMAAGTMQVLHKRPWNQQTLETALSSICEEFILPPNAPGGMVRYRRSLALSFFYKFYVHVAQEVNPTADSTIAADRSAKEGFIDRPIKSHQFFKIPESSGEHRAVVKHRAVGKPVPHKSAELHCTGEAVYVDDIPKTIDELYLGLVMSKKVHARILDIDATKALEMDGVVDFMCYKDLPENQNKTGLPGLPPDEEIFASKEVYFIYSFTSLESFFMYWVSEKLAPFEKSSKFYQITNDKNFFQMCQGPMIILKIALI